jgi:hypothetical protein
VFYIKKKRVKEWFDDSILWQYYAIVKEIEPQSFDNFVENYPIKKIKYCFWLFEQSHSTTRNYLHWADKNEFEEMSRDLEEFNRINNNVRP